MPVDDMAMTWLNSSMLLDDSPLQCVTLLEIKQKGQSISLVQAAFGVDRNIESESSLQCNGDPDCLLVFSKTSDAHVQLARVGVANYPSVWTLKPISSI